jgi:predicted site-specific integrase-resolvase
MPKVVDGQTYYRTMEVCRIMGVSRSTLFRWLKGGSGIDAKNRDRRGWRLFTEAEVEKLKREANRIATVGE